MMWGAGRWFDGGYWWKRLSARPRALRLGMEELPQGLYGSARASALATVDHHYNRNALIVADLSNDASYAEALYETLCSRVVGLQISRGWRWYGSKSGGQLKIASMLIYTIGRSYLLELFSRRVAIQSGSISP